MMNKENKPVCRISWKTKPLSRGRMKSASVITLICILVIRVINLSCFPLLFKSLIQMVFFSSVSIRLWALWYSPFFFHRQGQSWLVTSVSQTGRQLRSSNSSKWYFEENITSAWFLWRSKTPKASAHSCGGNCESNARPARRCRHLSRSRIFIPWNLDFEKDTIHDFPSL